MRNGRGRRLRRLGAWFGALAGLLLAALVLGVLVPRQPAAVATGERTHRVLLLSSAIHTDLALPAEPWILDRFGFLEKAGLPLRDPAVAYVLVGRGGRSFYVETPTWDELRPMPVLRSFGLDAAVLRIALAGAVDPETAGVRAIDLDETGLERLADFALSSLTRNDAGAAILLDEQPAAYGPFSRFFEAKGRFNALWGCNLWTAEALREAGLATGLWTPLPVLLALSLDVHR